MSEFVNCTLCGSSNCDCAVELVSTGGTNPHPSFTEVHPAFDTRYTTYTGYTPFESFDGDAKAKAVPQPKAAELLGRAAKHMHDRAATYDKPEGERSMGRAVDAFNAVTGHTLKESEGWLFMALLKAVRSETRSEPHQDSLEDLIAYTALYAEARGEGK